MKRALCLVYFAVATKEFTMGLFLCILLVVLCLGALPFWSHMQSREWGFWPSGIFGVLLAGVLLLVFYYDVISWR
jgi:pilus assembly protein TadC